MELDDVDEVRAEAESTQQAMQWKIPEIPGDVSTLTFRFPFRRVGRRWSSLSWSVTRKTPFFILQSYKLGSIGMKIRRTVRGVADAVPFRLCTTKAYGLLEVAAASTEHEITWLWENLAEPLTRAMQDSNPDGKPPVANAFWSALGPVFRLFAMHVAKALRDRAADSDACAAVLDAPESVDWALRLVGDAPGFWSYVDSTPETACSAADLIVSLSMPGSSVTDEPAAEAGEGGVESNDEQAGDVHADLHQAMTAATRSVHVSMDASAVDGHLSPWRCDVCDNPPCDPVRSGPQLPNAWREQLYCRACLVSLLDMDAVEHALGPGTNPSDPGWGFVRELDTVERVQCEALTRVQCPSTRLNYCVMTLGAFSRAPVCSWEGPRAAAAHHLATECSAWQGRWPCPHVTHGCGYMSEDALDIIFHAATSCTVQSRIVSHGSDPSIPVDNVFPFDDLPSDIVKFICLNMSPAAMGALACTNRRMHALLQPMIASVPKCLDCFRRHIRPFAIHPGVWRSRLSVPKRAGNVLHRGATAALSPLLLVAKAGGWGIGLGMVGVGTGLAAGGSTAARLTQGWCPTPLRAVIVLPASLAVGAITGATGAAVGLVYGAVSSFVECRGPLSHVTVPTLVREAKGPFSVQELGWSCCLSQSKRKRGCDQCDGPTLPSNASVDLQRLAGQVPVDWFADLLDADMQAVLQAIADE